VESTGERQVERALTVAVPSPTCITSWSKVGSESMSDPRVFNAFDDSDYRAWLREHPHGQVVNGLDGTGRQLHRSYHEGPVWHLASCGFIGGKGSRQGSVQSYTYQFPKACWGTRDDLDEWRERVGSPELWWCPYCKTDGRRE
jgi:hypothetical protein